MVKLSREVTEHVAFQRAIIRACDHAERTGEVRLRLLQAELEDLQERITGLRREIETAPARRAEAERKLQKILRSNEPVKLGRVRSTTNGKERQNERRLARIAALRQELAELEAKA